MMNMKLVPSLILLSVLKFLSFHHRYVYGANADSTCPKNCRPYEGEVYCNKTTGMCSEGCNEGFYGNNCDCTCHCGGGACVRADGTCMQTSSTKPVQVCPEQQTEDCQTGGYIAGISFLCVLVLICIAVIGILVFKRLDQGSKKQQSMGREDLPLMAEIIPSQTPEPVPQTVKEQPAHNLEGSMFSANSASRPLDQMTQSWKDKLLKDNGVHFLYNEDYLSGCFFLFCVHMKYDSSRVNTSKTHINEERYLVNKNVSVSREGSSERFKNFHGTTCLSPAYQGDCPTYWEVHCYVKPEQALQPRTLLLCIGLCREADRDVSVQIPSNPHCYKLIVGLWNEHKGICTRIYRDHEKNPSSDKPTGISNSNGGAIKYGILVYKGKEVIMFFDLMNTKLLCCLENVNFEKPLWPMFGVLNRSDSCRVSMKLETTRYIKLSSENKGMILDALSRLK